MNLKKETIQSWIWVINIWLHNIPCYNSIPRYQIWNECCMLAWSSLEKNKYLLENWNQLEMEFVDNCVISHHTSLSSRILVVFWMQSHENWNFKIELNFL